MRFLSDQDRVRILWIPLLLLSFGQAFASFHKIGEIEEEGILEVLPLSQEEQNLAELQRIERALQFGKPKTAERIYGSGMNCVFSVLLEDPVVPHQTLRAIFKPRPYGDGEGWNNVTKEYTAYYLAQNLLGMDYVPPSAYRYHVFLPTRPHSSFYYEGSFSFQVYPAKKLVEVPQDQWNINGELLKSDHRILRVLLGDPDGHEGNVLFGPNWIGDHLQSKPVFIDFGASFFKKNLIGAVEGPRLEAPMSMRHYTSHTGIFGKTEIKVIRKKTWDRLKAIVDHAQKEQSPKERDEVFKGLSLVFLSPTEREEFLERAGEIVHYFEGLAESQSNPIIIE